ncbi:Phospholipase D1, partial [Teratosphaeriaceae sp. CCFEE 6253]
MATATVAPSQARDESRSPMSRSPRDVSPSTAPYAAEEEMLRKTNGYVSSPLRVQQRLASLDDKKLPELPNGRPEENGTQGPGRAASVHWDAPGTRGSFPFEAQPGTVGPEPTTNDLVATKTTESSPVALQRKRANGSGSMTPAHRRSVQFARDTLEEDVVASSPLQRTQTWEAEEHDGERAPNTKERDRQASFFGKLKALASPSSPSYHTRAQSGSTGFATPMGALSPQSERSEPTYPIEPSEAADADIEEEESDRDQVDELRPKKRRMSKRPAAYGADSGPSTPKQSRFASFRRDHPMPGSSNRPANLSRNNTLSDMSDSGQHNAGVSEDEGRDRIRSAWRKGLDGARGLSYAARKHDDTETPHGPQRPGALRRITGIGGLDGGNSPFRARADRQASTSAQKWRQVKSAMKVMTQRKKDERMKVDHQKSAQLMAELLAGAPAALVFASMYQRDEHGHRKVPVLLEQLKIKISHSEMRNDNTGDRHLIFKVDMEYGNGPARMVWTIRRTLQDFVNLHWKYKGQSAAEKVGLRGGRTESKAKMPKFPKSAFPYARGARGLFEKLMDEDEAEDITQDNLDGVGEGSGTDGAVPQRPPLAGRKHTRRKSSFAPPRRTSTGEFVPANIKDPDSLNAIQREKYNEHQRKKLERYLQQMIRWLIFRADSTRLC